MQESRIIIENTQDIKKVDEALIKLIKNSVNKSLEVESYRGPVEVSVLLVDNLKIKELNDTHRNICKETDVLSFPMLEYGEEDDMLFDKSKYDYNYDEGAILLGDIVISLEKATSQANEYGHSLEREVAFLTVHSMLHLFGYDHINEVDRQVMRGKEETILKQLRLVR